MLAGRAIDQDVGSRAEESWAGSVWDLFDWVIWRVVSNMITSTPRGIHQQQPNISPDLEQMYLMLLVNGKKRQSIDNQWKWYVFKINSFQQKTLH